MVSLSEYIDATQMVLQHLRDSEIDERNLDCFIQKQPSQFHHRLKEEFCGDGPLFSLINRSDITEIVVNGTESIWFEQNRRFHLFEDRFLSQATYENFVQRLCTEANINVHCDVPFGDGVWRTYRVHVARPPVTSNVQLTLRARPALLWTLDRLRELSWASEHQIEVLRTWLVKKYNFLVIGPTGSGKTSVLNALLQELHSDERVICLEDVQELYPKSGASCQLLTRFDSHEILKPIGLQDLVRQSLRMRPDRIVMGEVRGAEAKDLLMALATGHEGSLGTLHAQNPKQALLRLEMLVQLGASQWDLTAIRQLIQLSLQGLVVLSVKDGKRALEGIYQIASLESFGFLVEKIA